MGIFSSVKKAFKSVSKATGGIIPTNFKDALGNAVTLGTLGIANTGNGTLGQENGGILSGSLGNVVQGAVGLGQDYLQSQINLAQQKELAKYNAEQQSMLNQQAFDQNVQMWNKQNAYNTPLQQMKRLKQAGLNPNLVYGGGNVSGNTAGSAPELQPARFDTGAFHPVDTRIERAQLALAMESQYQQVQNQKIQNDLARQKITLAERAADRADARLMLRNSKVTYAQPEKPKKSDKNFTTGTMEDANRIVEDLTNKGFYGMFKYLDWLTSGYRERKRVENRAKMLKYKESIGW